jgi:hypothetical protein
VNVVVVEHWRIGGSVLLVDESRDARLALTAPHAAETLVDFLHALFVCLCLALGLPGGVDGLPEFWAAVLESLESLFSTYINTIFIYRFGDKVIFNTEKKFHF